MSDRDEISAYVLGDLEPAAAERLRAREAADPGFAAEVAAVRALVAQLGDLGPEEWDPVEPPPLRYAPQPAPRRRSWWRPVTLRPALAVTAAVLLLGVGVAIGALVAGGGGGGGGGGGRVVALAPVGQAPRSADGTADLRDGTMRLSARGLPGNARGDFYEVWMMRSPTDLVSVGSFTVGTDGRATVDMPVTASTARYPIIDVSLEPGDGNPGHSGMSVLRSRPI